MAKWDLMLPSLCKAYEGKFLFGNIMSPRDFDTPEFLDMYRHHYNIVTVENAMKPMYVAISPEEYNFTEPDKFADWAEKNGIKLHAHTLIWHAQSPQWLNRNTDATFLTRTQAKESMEQYIKKYAGRYKGRIYSWDVMNEIMQDLSHFEGDWRRSLRQEQSRSATSAYWYLAYANGADSSKGESGADYVFDAFYFTRKYDPEAKLYYNDYNDEVPAKREAIAQMVEQINEQWKNHPEYDERLLIEGIGMQGHYNQGTNLAHVRESLERFIKTGAVISITELDITIGEAPQRPPRAANPPTPEEWREIMRKAEQTPAPVLTPEQSKLQADMYAALFNLYSEFSEHIERVTFWAVSDGTSWRKWGAPVLFDQNLQAKEAFHAVINCAGLQK